MTHETKMIRRWVIAWQNAGIALQSLNRKEMRSSNTPQSMQALDDAFEFAIADRPISQTSGLVEQQRWFGLLRYKCSR